MRTKKTVGKKKKPTLNRYVRSSPTRTKKTVGKKKKPTLNRYVCSNPTCSKVFEKPKVVRHFACPYCLSKIVETDQAKNPPATTEERKEAETKSAPSNKPVESQIENKPATTKEEGKQRLNWWDQTNLWMMEIENKPVTTEERKEAETKSAPSNKPVESQIENKPVTTEERKEAAEVPEKLDLAPPDEIPRKINAVKTKDGQCKYYFGYLPNREKGEGIPETCVECPKSIDCMLSKLKSPTAVSEIKKWYNILAA